MKNKSTKRAGPNPTDKKWYEKPIGYILITVIASLIAGYLIYCFGWNAPKEQKPSQSTAQQGQATSVTNTLQKSPLFNPPKQLKSSLSMSNVHISGFKDGIIIENIDNIKMNSISTKNTDTSDGRGITIINKPSKNE